MRRSTINFSVTMQVLALCFLMGCLLPPSRVEDRNRDGDGAAAEAAKAEGRAGEAGASAGHGGGEDDPPSAGAGGDTGASGDSGGASTKMPSAQAGSNATTSKPSGTKQNTGGAGGTQTAPHAGASGSAAGAKAPVIRVADDEPTPPSDSRAWSAPMELELAGAVGIGSYSVVLDGAGNGMSTWTAEDAVWSSAYKPGQGWAARTPVPMDDPPSTVLDLLAGDTAGNLFLFYHAFARNGSGPQIALSNYYPVYVKRYAENSWSTALSLGNLYQAQVAQAMNGNGDAIVCVAPPANDSASTGWSLVGYRFAPSTGWTQPMVIKALTATSSDSSAQQMEAADGPIGPNVAMNRSGSAVLTWNTRRHGLWAMDLEKGLSGEPTQLSPSAANGNMSVLDPPAPLVAIDDAGNAMVVSSAADGGVGHVYVWPYSKSSGWSDRIQVDAATEGNAYSPSLAMDAEGRAVAIWTQADATKGTSIWFNRYTPHSGWRGAQQLEPSAMREANYVRLGVDQQGRFIAAWYDKDMLRASRYQGASGWSTPTQLNTGKADSYAPQLAVSASGSAIVSWREDSSVPNRQSRFE